MWKQFCESKYATEPLGVNDRYTGMWKGASARSAESYTVKRLLAGTCVILKNNLHLSSKKKNQPINKTNTFYS